MGSREMRIAGHAVTETDLVRMVIIASLTASCTIVTFLAFSRSREGDIGEETVTASALSPSA